LIVDENDKPIRQATRLEMVIFHNKLLKLNIISITLVKFNLVA